MRARPPAVTVLLAAAASLGACAQILGDFDTNGPNGNGGSTSSHASAGVGTGGKASSSTGMATSSTTGMGGTTSGTGGSSTAVGGGATVGSSTVATTGSTSTSSTSASSSSGIVACPGSETCVSVPAGWDGPIVLETGTSPPGCTTAGWPNLAIQGGFDIVPPTGCTQCSCSGPTGGTCPSNAKLGVFMGTSCNGPMGQMTVSTPCQPFSSASAKGSPTQAVGATCNTTPAVPNGQPTFGMYGAACSGGAGAMCAGGVCVPAAAHVCAYLSGDVACPASYPVKTVIYAGLNDTFSCTDCTCSVTTAPTCEPTSTFYMDTNCQMTVTNLTLDGTSCGLLAGGAQSVELTSLGTPSGGACAVTGGGTLSGAASGTGPVTICCTN